MAKATFTGSVTNQAAEGQTVTIAVTKPDNTQDVIIAQTLPDKNFSAEKEYPAGDYSAIASVEADGVYKSAVSASVPFTISLVDRSITLNVAVG